MLTSSEKAASFPLTRPLRSQVSFRDRIAICISGRSHRNFAGFAALFYRALIPLTQLAYGLLTWVPANFEKALKWSQNRLGQPTTDRLRLTSTDQLGEAWAWINHSEPNVVWREETDDVYLESVRSTLVNWPPYRRRNWYCIDRLDEDNATCSFRVSPGIVEDPFVLRFHVGRASQSDMISNQAIRQWIVSKDIFSDSRAAHWLRPIASGIGKTCVSINNLVVQKGRKANYAECFPCAHNVSHYSSPSEIQIASFAERLGRLQGGLQSLPTDLLPKIVDREREAYWCDPPRLQKGLEDIKTFCADQRPDAASDVVKLWLNNEGLVFNWLERCLAHWSSRESDMILPLLHDIHTHNVFFVDNRCALIYDYSFIHKWPVGDVVAYSMHRFVREWVRETCRRRDPHTIDQVPSRIDDFISGYHSGGGPALPRNFRDTLDLRIAGVALCKLRSVSLTAFNRRIDKSDRDERTMLSEVGKFISFLKEASFFGNALKS